MAPYFMFWGISETSLEINRIVTPYVDIKLGQHWFM